LAFLKVDLLEIILGSFLMELFTQLNMKMVNPLKFTKVI